MNFHPGFFQWEANDRKDFITEKPELGYFNSGFYAEHGNRYDTLFNYFARFRGACVIKHRCLESELIRVATHNRKLRKARRSAPPILSLTQGFFKFYNVHLATANQFSLFRVTTFYFC